MATPIRAAVLLALLSTAAITPSSAADSPDITGLGGDPPTVEVTLKQRKFDPSELTVDPGTTIRFTNLDDGICHTVTRGDVTGACSSATGSTDEEDFDFRLPGRNDSVSIRFTLPGNMTISCKPHPGMNMTLQVAAEPVTPAPPGKVPSLEAAAVLATTAVAMLGFVMRRARFRRKGR
jgi:plastocyanin